MTSSRRWAILAVVLAADTLDLIDSSVTTIAAPTIAADLHGGPGLVQWLGAAYALALGVLLVVGGRMGDRFGRRRVFLTGIAGFTLASLACGLAVDPVSIVVARLAQGGFGALLIPQGFGILAAAFPRDQLRTAFGAFAPVLGISAIGGPLLGGFLVQADLLGLGWRPVFLINIVLGGAGALAAAVLLPRDAGDRDVRIDGRGAALLAVAMLGVLNGMISGSSGGWTGAAWAQIAVGLAAGIAFGRRQATAPAPLITPSLLRSTGFTAGLLLGVAYFAVVTGLFLVLSLYLQGGMALTPARAAVALCPIMIGIIVASFAGRPLVGRWGRVLVLAGLVLTVLGSGSAAVLVAVGVPVIGLAPALFAVGLGMGACFATIYDVTLGDADPTEAGSASGTLSAVQQLANALGAAGVTTLWFHLLGAGQRPATALTLGAVAGLTLGCCALVRLMPRHAPAAAPA